MTRWLFVSSLDHFCSQMHLMCQKAYHQLHTHHSSIEHFTWHSRSAIMQEYNSLVYLVALLVSHCPLHLLILVACHTCHITWCGMVVSKAMSPYPGFSKLRRPISNSAMWIGFRLRTPWTWPNFPSEDCWNASHMQTTQHLQSFPTSVYIIKQPDVIAFFPSINSQAVLFPPLVLAPKPELRYVFVFSTHFISHLYIRVAALQVQIYSSCPQAWTESGCATRMCAILAAYSYPAPRGTPGLSQNEVLSSVHTVHPIPFIVMALSIYSDFGLP